MAIGIFDSGLGGLSVLKSLRGQLPAENFIYVADTAYCPYGALPMGKLVERACRVSTFLFEQNAKAIVVACNTATVSAIHLLRQHFPVPFVGMEPAVKPAAALTRTGVIGVLATQTTAGTDRLQYLIREFARSVRVLKQPCPGLVERIESGDLGGPRTRALVHRYTDPLLEKGADILVLGCTHYPFLRGLIQEVVGDCVQLIEGGDAVARRTAIVLTENRLNTRPQKKGGIVAYTSSDPSRVGGISRALWPNDIGWKALPGKFL